MRDIVGDTAEAPSRVGLAPVSAVSQLVTYLIALQTKVSSVAASAAPTPITMSRTKEHVRRYHSSLK